MPGGFGNYDIYDRNQDDGSLGEPINRAKDNAEGRGFSTWL